MERAIAVTGMLKLPPDYGGTPAVKKLHIRAARAFAEGDISPPPIVIPLTLVSRASVPDPLTWIFDAVGGAPPYTFDFGDGTEPVTQSEAHVQHTFAELGEYSVLLTDTAEASDVENITVDANVPPLEIVWPLDGSTMPPVFNFLGHGATPETEVELWSSGRETPNDTVLSSAYGEFAFTGDQAATVGTDTWHVVCGENTSPEITITVVSE